MRKQQPDHELRLDTVLAATDDGWWDCTIRTGEVYYSPRWATMLGYEPEEIEPHRRSWEKLLHPDDKLRVLNALNDHLEGRSPSYQAEARMRAKSGEWVWILTRGRVLARDRCGRPLRIAGTHTDITERKSAETREHILYQQFLSRTDKEKQHFFRELHEEFGKILTTLQLGVGTLELSLPERLKGQKSQCKTLIELIAHLTDHVRDLSNELWPGMLELLGIVSALRWHIQESREKLHGIEVDFQTNCEHSRFSLETEIALYRSCQEALHNVARHARSRQVYIRLTCASGQIVLIIQDDGVGFDPKRADFPGVGIWSVQERIAALGGGMNIISAMGKGTKIEVELPVH